MFLSKLLPGRNVAKTKLELLTESWTNIQKYYETADGTERHRKKKGGGRKETLYIFFE